MSAEAIPNSKRKLGEVAGFSSGQRLVALGSVCLLLASAIAFLYENGLQRFLFSYLLSWAFCLSLSLGAIVFVAIQHVTNATWSVAVRRIAEFLGLGVSPLAILFLPIALSVLLGDGRLYEWNSASMVAADPIIAQKSPYLNRWFFLVRCIGYFTVWIWLARSLLKFSAAQDRDRVTRTDSLKSRSVIALFTVGITLTFAAFDLLMSLDPHWFSSIYGIYFLSGSLVGAIATLVLLVAGLQKLMPGQDVINTNHRHDLGKLLFGFTCFWAYIAFSQYLLIWCANIPEETGWYAVRQSGPWRMIAFALIAGHFVLPFFGLLSRNSKRNVTTLTIWAAILLVMHWVDLYWLIMPELSETALPLSIVDLLCLCGIVALMTAGIIRLGRDSTLFATGDPGFEKSVAVHHS